ncbi:interferon-induced GTP-binding protein [Colletotrichum incanum]|nr:interferon-induced GTP-binding protein [Colletotrichum incanum]
MAPPQSTGPSAAEYLQDSRFEQTFTLPPDNSYSEPFKVTYSDFGFRAYAGPEHDNVVLFCAPLLASRFLHITKDKLAKKQKVRIINVDRPGFGGTTPVPAAEDRVMAWLRIVPALLEHLGIHHVAIVAQSAGTIYALNTLLYLPHLLHPTRPYAALCVPWMHPSHSEAALMSMVHKLPAAAIATVDVLATFFNSTLQPVTGFSSGVFSALIGSLGMAKERSVVDGADADDAPFEDAVKPEIAAHAFRQGCSGMGQEAVMLLKRSGPADVWGSWLDIDSYVPLLSTQIKAGATADTISPAAQQVSESRTLKVEVFYSEEDNMIGTKAGPEWFDNCWSAEHRADAIEYSSVVVPDTAHDTILDLRFGIAEEILKTVKQRNSDEA